ncbi:hypothetical protein [Bacteroides sp.]|uniref:hypothetical protein n=1 Tax=Bacteroides sp. TaxID=29523 RepID=UPI0026388898|nr:hypothetical protein [Bacteroides sp.]MDD3039033.1 hypothetical protein [Bacteroides sp.]
MIRYMIYGSSDDLVEIRVVEHDLVEASFVDEFCAYDSSLEKPVILTFSTRTKIIVYYGNDGIWNIEVVDNGEGASIGFVSAASEDTIYTDVLFVTAPDLHIVSAVFDDEDLM